MKKNITFIIVLIFITVIALVKAKVVQAAYYNLVSPTNGSTTSSLTPTFSWTTDNPYSGGSGYTCVNICAGSDTACNTPITGVCANPGATSATYTGSSLQSNTQYRWLAYGYSGTTYWATSTSIWAFTTSIAQTPPVADYTMIEGATGCTYNNTNLDNGLVSHWDMDQKGPIVPDTKANNNASAIGTTYVTGLSNSARSFNGGSDFLNITDNTSLAPTTMSFAAWIKPTSFTAGNMPIYNRRTTGNVGGISVELNNAAAPYLVCYFYIGGAWRSAIANKTLNYNQWQFVGCSYDGANITAVAGQAGGPLRVDSTPQTGSINNPVSAQVAIGKDVVSKTYFNGQIDEVSLWNRGLSPAELTTAFNSGTPLTCGPPAVVPDDATTYTITVATEDNNGGSDITQQQAIINLNGASRGLVGWQSSDAANIWGPGNITYFSDHHCALYTAGGTAYAFGSQFLDVANSGCSSTVTGNQRVTTFSLKFKQNFFSPVTNTLSQNAYDSVSNTTSWVTGNSFNIAPQACVVPTGSTNFAYSSGLVDWWNLDEGSGLLNADLLGANDLLAKNSLYQSLTGWWKMDSDTTDATGQNSSSTAGSLGCNFKVSGSYDNTLPANLLSYWKLDEPPPSPTCDFSYLNPSLASGKVSYWTMNEVSSRFAEAIATVDQWNSYNGTFTGTTSTVGKVGNARNFANTSTDYITVTDQPLLRLNASTGFSTTAWIYPTGSPTYGEILNKDQNYILRYEPDGRIDCLVYAAGSFEPRVTSTTAAPLNTWTHLACTWDGTSLKLYVNNGTPVTGTKTGAVSGATTPLYMGQASSGNTFKGNIDEVTVWNKPLSATEVGLLYNSGNGVACQVPSPNYADAMGLNPGIPGSGTNLTPTLGKINNGQNFNGTSDYLSIGGPNLSTAFALPYTFATWVKFNAVNKGTDNAILGQGSATTDQGLQIGERGGKLYFGFYNDDLAGTTTLSPNIWYHVAFVFDRTNQTKQIFLNGNLDASGPTNRYFSILANAQLGQYPWATNNKLNGVLDEAAFWITPLSATQIGYLAGLSSCDAGPVAVPGKIAVGMAFGSNDGVTTPHIDLSAGLTAAAWVKPRDTTHNYNSNYQIIMAQENNFLLGMSKNSNRVTAQVNIGGAWLGGFDLPSSILPLNQWTYLVMAWDKNNIYVYLNGTLYNQYPAAGNLTASSANLYFGKRPDYTAQSQTYNGYLDDVAIWKRALSGAEIATLYNNEVTGQSYDPNSNNGPTFVSPGATNPTQTNLTNYPPLTNVPPTTSHAKSFNGGGDYLVNAAPSGLPTGSTMTVSSWVKPTGTYANPSYNGVVSFGPRTSNNSFLLALQNSGKPTFAAWGNDFVPTGGSVITVTPNQWNHLAAVLSGSSITLYVNGQTNSQMTGTLASIPNIQSGPLVIGATDYNPPGRFYNGAIDEVRIYNRALSATEVSDEYSRYQRDTGKAISPTCGGVCGQRVQNFMDPYCVSVNQDCNNLQDYAQITGNIMNAPSSASLTVSANGPPNLTASAANNQITTQNGVTTYSFSQNNTPQNGALKSTTYVMNANTISGYSVNPNNYQLDVACTDVTGPTFWYDSDAGMTNQTFSPVGSNWYNGGAGGKISQSGNPPGYHLDGYQDVTPVSKVTYDELLGQTNKNSGLGANNPCAVQSGQPGYQGPGVQNFTAGTTVYQYWCYDQSTYPFESRLRTATTTPYGSPNVIVLYPDPGVATWTLKQITGSTFAVPASRTIIAFVPASLEIQQKVTVAASSGLVMVLKATNASNPDLAGNLYIDNTVGCASTGSNCTIASEGSALDGVYVFPGFFTDTYSGGSSNRKLIGQGSLIGTGNSSLGLNRTLGAITGPGEEWHFQSKYLKMYQNILSGPRYSWKELPPQ